MRYSSAAAALAVAGLLALTSACGGASRPQQSMTQSYAYRYGETIGALAYITAMTSDGKAGAAALCQSETERITSNFVPVADLVDFPQWKKSGVKQHPGWFFLGLKAGCKQ
jgi:hypothetical protein